MKNYLSAILFILFILSNSIVSAQTTEYSKTKIDGENYIIYNVSPGEGIFGIARKFEVTQEELIKLNPAISEGLKVGQELLIPINKKSKINLVNKNSKTENTSSEYTYHKVDKKQTLFAISRKYNVHEEDIKILNPTIANGLKEGSIIKIPKKADRKELKRITSESEIEKPKYTTHIVKEDETLYSISRLYKVNVSDILESNPESADKLEINTILKIPTIKVSLQNIETTVPKNQTSTIPKSTLKKIIKIAYLLPFMVNDDKQDPTIKRFIEFYSGSLIAIQRAKERGISCEIFTFDTEKSEQKLIEVLNNQELKKMDLIVGPALSNQISIISDFAKENKINTLIPFSSKVSEIDSNPYLFQFNPGPTSEINFTLEILSSKFKNSNIIFAQIPEISSFDEGKVMSNALQKGLSKKGYSFSKIELTTPENTDFKSVLKSSKDNIIIFNTDKYSFVQSYIPVLRSTTKQFSVILYEQNNWKNQSEKIPSSFYISPFMAKSNSKELSDYNKQYVKLINEDISKDSPRFDILGYDLTNFFVSTLYRQGNNFSDKVVTLNITNCIQSQPHFVRESNDSGFINQQLYITIDK